jgi:hypothetical protein
VVPPAVPVEVAAAMAAMLGRRTEHVMDFDADSDDSSPESEELEPLDMPAVCNVQLVSAPDAVVASLGGVFATMTTMAEVTAAHRDVATLFDRHHWTVKTHRLRVCTAAQRACAHMVLLIGSRLYSQSNPRSRLVVGSVRGLAHTPQLLPALPEELLLWVLGWLRRSELGVRTM